MSFNPSFVRFLSPETRKKIIEVAYKMSNMDPVEFGKAIGVSRSGIYKLLAGTIAPSDETILAIFDSDVISYSDKARLMDLVIKDIEDALEEAKQTKEYFEMNANVLEGEFVE